MLLVVAIALQRWPIVGRRPELEVFEAMGALLLAAEAASGAADALSRAGEQRMVTAR